MSFLMILLDEDEPYILSKFLKFMKKCNLDIALQQVTPQTSSTNFSQTHSWAVQSWEDQNYGSYYS